MKLPTALRARIAALPFGRWWATKTRRERQIVGGLGTVVVIASAWFLVWQPMQQDIVRLRGEAPTVRAELSDAQRMAAEIAGLSRTGSAARPPAAPAVVAQILAERGLGPSAVQITWDEGRARLTANEVRFDTLLAALDAVQRDAGLRVIDATLTARVDPGTVRAEIVLGR